MLLSFVIVAAVDSSAGRRLASEWRGRRVWSWVPAPLEQRNLTVSTATARAAERAVAALRLSDAGLPARFEPLARLLLRHEGVASSGIEGLREPIESVLVAEKAGTGGTAGWIADNLAVMDRALAAATEPLSVATLHDWHRHLMRYSSLPAHLVGAFRPSLGWVGGSSPLDASYVSPPPREVPRLMDDLLRFADSRSELDAVSRAALVHAQFEAIHPYGDGNGRLGRVLVCRALRREGATRRATAPISTAIARDPGGYLSGLRMFEQGNTDAWVRWFAETAVRAAATTEHLVGQASHLLAQWGELVADLRSDHSARALLEHLPAAPVLSAGDVSARVGVSERSGLAALRALADRGILTPLTGVPAGRPGRARHWFAATGLIDLWNP